MSEDKQQVHRPGAYKQVNKSHKHGRHRSKGSISVSSKGKISVKTATKKRKDELNRRERQHQAKQLRKNKLDEILSQKRAIGSLGNPPFLVCVLPLQKQVDPGTALDILTNCDSEAIVNKSSTGVTHLSIPRFKQRYSFIVPALDNEFAILDALKISDTVLFVTTAVNEDEVIDEWGQTILEKIFAQGLPTPVIAVTDLESINPKKRNDHKNNIQKAISKHFFDEKIMTLDKYADGINIIRKIGNQKRKPVTFRDSRPHLLAEKFEYVPEEKGENGVLKITGYLRGAGLSVNGLVHIPGLGDFQMSQINEPYDPYPLNPKKEKKPLVTEDGKVAEKVLGRSDPSLQESLESECIPEDIDDEQMLPSQEEIAFLEKQRQANLKVPKGTSDYQALWHTGGDDEEDNDDDDMEQDDEMDDDEISDEEMSGKEEEESDREDFDDNASEAPANEEKYDKEMDLDEEKEALKKVRAAKVDFQFPDEIDTPLDTTARVRFQKYKYLESFRQSSWDPLENLPAEYGRIIQFRDFKATKIQVKREFAKQEATADVGTYITVYVNAVPKSLWTSFQSTNPPVTLMGMLPHEHKMSVVNVKVKRTKNYDGPIKSKERLIFQCGYRRFAVNPIFSEHTNGKKFKFERFFQENTVSVATFFAPLQFPPAPVLCYKEINNKLVLVAKGELLSCAPSRIILKRVVLTGHPFKVHKKSAVVRFMFFNPDDIKYFQICELKTKLGLRGKIKEALGTHGHMKCYFNKPVKHHDTVMLHLYKRVYPKWLYEDLVVSCPNTTMEM